MEPEVEVKPGWKTTEFWITLIATIIPVAVAVGIINSEEAKSVQEALARAIQNGSGLIAFAAIAWKFIQSRGEVKKARAEAITRLQLASLTGPAGRNIAVILIALIALNPCLAYAADYNFLVKNGQHYLVNKDDPSKPNTPVSVSITDLGGIGPSPVVPPIVVPPSTDLQGTVKAALAAIPNYAAKDTDTRSLAFTLNFLSSVVRQVGDVAQARGIVRQGADLSLKENKAKWDGWWISVDAKLNTMSLTGPSYAQALGDIATALTAGLPAADEQLPQLPGEKTFGLDLAKIMELMIQLMPLIKLIMSLFQQKTAIDIQPMPSYCCSSQLSQTLAA